MSRLKGQDEIQVLICNVLVNEQRKDRRRRKTLPVRTGVSLKLYFTERKDVTPAPPVVGLFREDLVLVLLSKRIERLLLPVSA